MSINKSSKRTLDPNKVPQALRHLTSLAEKWGIGDDIERATLISTLTITECEELVNLVPPLEDAFDEWLAGPETANPPYSAEYMAFTELRDVSDAAIWKLKNHKF